MKKGYSLLDAVLAVALVGIIAAMLLPALFSLNKIVSRENTNLDILEACKSQMEREIAAQYSDTIPVRDNTYYDFQVFINPVGELNEIKLILSFASGSFCSIFGISACFAACSKRSFVLIDI